MNTPVLIERLDLACRVCVRIVAVAVLEIWAVTDERSSRPVL